MRVPTLQDLTTSPVDIETFIKDPEYLGAYFTDVYPYWVDKLKSIYADPLHPNCVEVWLAGSYGTGRTTAAVIGFLYDLYILTLVKNPHEIWSLMPTMSINLAIVGHTVNGCYSDMILDALSTSPYFRSKILPGKGAVLQDNMFANGIGIMCIHPSDFSVSNLLGKDIVGAIFETDTGDCSPDSAYEKTYSTLYRRFYARCVNQAEISLCRLWMVSSAEGLLTSFLKSHVDTMLVSPVCEYIAPSIWDVQAHKGIYCGKTFPVYVGDADTESYIVPDAGRFADAGHVIHVPIEYRQDFEKDICAAIRDLAGIPVQRPEPKKVSLRGTFRKWFISRIGLRGLYGLGIFAAFFLGIIYGMYGV